uniref:Tyrosine specific protein phosphatases domain-containing protein n=1 Tax=Panagrolaimus sp. PS1159 TaxID=55785 RepID=A0AC35GP46_9BILA
MDQTLKEKHANGITKEKAMEFGIPNHWENCPKIGKIIQGIFLPFKTPLSDAYDDLLEDATKFYPQEIFDNTFEGVKDGAKVKLWINLSNTERYYGWKAVTSNDCQYVHIPLRGHNETPSEEETKKFIGIVNDFVKEYPNDIVAVHCTHGFNRTGFLIASYLIQTMKWNVEKAVKEFAEARPNGIYKEDYLKDLCQRFDSPDSFEAPGLPVWHNIVDGISEMGLEDKPKRNPRFNNANIRGVHFIDDPEKQEALLKHLQKLLQPFSSMNLEASNKFSGSQPVLMNKQNICLLSSHPYKVTWKAYGTRYLIYIKVENEIYAVDCDNNVFQLPLKFPKKDSLDEHISETVIEVDMITEKNIVNERIWYNNKMFIYDIIIHEGEEIGKKSYQERYFAINQFLTSPRSQAIKKRLSEKESIYVFRKTIYNISKSEFILGPGFCETTKHVDSLIFQPSEEPYTCESNTNLLE